MDSSSREQAETDLRRAHSNLHVAAFFLWQIPFWALACCYVTHAYRSSRSGMDGAFQAGAIVVCGITGICFACIGECDRRLARHRLAEIDAHFVPARAVVRGTPASYVRTAVIAIVPFVTRFIVLGLGVFVLSFFVLLVFVCIAPIHCF